MSASTASNASRLLWMSLIIARFKGTPRQMTERKYEYYDATSMRRCVLTKIVLRRFISLTHSISKVMEPNGVLYGALFETPLLTPTKRSGMGSNLSTLSIKSCHLSLYVIFSGFWRCPMIAIAGIFANGKRERNWQNIQPFFNAASLYRKNASAFPTPRSSKVSTR